MTLSEEHQDLTQLKDNCQFHHQLEDLLDLFFPGLNHHGVIGKPEQQRKNKGEIWFSHKLFRFVICL